MEPHPASDPLTASRLGPSVAARAAARRGLYVHVPFCAVRCSYCDFSSGALSAAAVERYLAAMALETARRAPDARGAVFTSVFFGGGTPSALSARHFTRLAALVRGAFAIADDAEITLEANPESVRAPLLEAWATAGVNRLSMGAQSFDAEELEGLGRIHDAARPGEAFALARAHGFRRLSLDLMFGFPGNDGGRLARTLDRALALDPEHLSAYCYIPEPGTPLGDRVLRRDVALPSTDAQADEYAMLTARLEAAGFAGYETSNFARAGAEARHNLVYWLRRDHMALGPSAHGLWNGVRFGNHYAFERWAASLEADASCDATEIESARSRADEIVMLGLRLGCGLDASDHPATRWADVLRRYGAAFEQGLALGRLEPARDGVRIPRAHRFVADDTIAWLMAAADRPSRGPLGDVVRGRTDLTPARSAP
ncbi:MAG: radical SAM family heme chaperone HemW [Candidatus Eisenbacteria bacterium]|uniref:Heme chaperone HemW n=1 Tax=Eiseniibacteriota bacterium TaxID=2212470 RepID=A0A9D6QJG7_UNCEI|nr:radical SAM family heme chaperone HemW [Candidatus Eisenbacteria bacterium]MBI3539240.1 radical SAM family heme chaperone HemW [Candidatus Eisenbacteria bacterium]